MLPSRTTLNWRRFPVFAVALALLVLSLYSPCLTGDYIWDDTAGLMLGNPQMEASWGWLENWYRPQTPNYEPVTFGTFWVQKRLWGENRLVFHGTNLLLHLFNAWLFAGLLTALRLPGSRIAGTLFAIHPVAVETVAWIYERNNLLSVLFVLLSAHAWVRAGEGWTRGHVFALGCFAMSLLSKTLTVAYPILLLGSAFMGITPRTAKSKRWLPAFFLLSLAAGLLRWYYEQGRAAGESASGYTTGIERVLNASRALVFYLSSFCWPIDLHMPYSRWSIDPSDPTAWLPPLGIGLVVIGCGVCGSGVGRPVACAAAFYCLCRFPVRGFIETAYFQLAFVADHWQYFALLGPTALVGAALHTGWERLLAGRWRQLAWGG
ncbi:MAG: hypothetical protein AB7F89_14260, partial [Pirellulaceae bacterium]